MAITLKDALFLENLEWLDESGSEVAHRIPEHGSGEIKYGAQCTVRDSQAAVFYSTGQACDALGPGRHTLTTKNVPILTKILSLPWGGKSPFRAEVYFVNLKLFNNLKWGTRDPVAFRDSELGLVRLRAHGICDIQVTQPVLFINSLVGTESSYPIDRLESYVSEVVVSRLNDHLGEHLKTLFDLPSQYKNLAAGLSEKLTDDLSRYGIALQNLYLNAITPPAEVQEAIDEKSRLGVFDGNLEGLLEMKTAMAIEKGAAGGGAAEGGIGMGLGLMIPGLLSGMRGAALPGAPAAAGTTQHCPDCDLVMKADARFCPHCGHQVLVLRKCVKCSKNLGPKAKFCPACGTRAGTPAVETTCAACGTRNLPEARFCNECGEKL